MSWKRHHSVVGRSNRSVTTRSNYSDPSIGSSNNYSSILPEVYAGHPERINRYSQYDQMDMDSQIYTALNTIADFSTQSDPTTSDLFQIKYNGDPTDVEVDILTNMIRQWTRLNKFKNRLWRIFRNVIKYGDEIMIRDPETLEWFHVPPEDVQAVIINEAKGKETEIYLIQNLDVNLQTMTAAQSNQYGSNLQSVGTSSLQNPLTPGNYVSSGRAGAYGDGSSNVTPVDATNVVHLSLSEGLDAGWPFGTSILESVYRDFKQKQLLEDAIMIYRIQRAPERRVFYVDVGNMPPHKAHAWVERMKNEIHQRRLPSRTGGDSNVTNAAYNPMCLDLSTRIPLLDGRTLSLTQLIDEYQSGKENWVYSCNPETGQVVPGNITWAGITRKNTQVIRLTLDNGATLTCTPDHKIPVQGKGFVEAKDITEFDSLIPMNRRMKSLSNDTDRSYEQIFDISDRKWKFTHRVVGNFFKNINKHQEFTYKDLLEEKTVIHHKDYNRYNNDPRNLQWMGKRDHILFHSEQKRDWWNNITEEELTRVKNKIRTSLKNYRDSLSVDEIEILAENRSRGIKASISEMRKNDPDAWNAWKKNQGISLSKSLDTQEKRNKRAEPFASQQKKPWANTKFLWSPEMEKYFIDFVKEHPEMLLQEIEKNLTNDPMMITLMKSANTANNFINKVNTDKFTRSKTLKFFSKYNYKSFIDFKNKIGLHNHKITKIEWLSEPMDVGTITVDGQERWHNFHTFAIESGIFVKNSMIEDFWFPQTADGRGSKVTTLPGGEGLGNIDDLNYFNNQLAAGLGVPQSYLTNPGSSDQGATFNDGRLGTAYIQEFRFSEYCQRLQRLVEPVFDREFKLYLKQKGFENIDSSLFEIELNTPQHFSDYAKIEKQQAQINLFTQLADMKIFSKRWLMINYLGLTLDEITQNEEMWREENPEAIVNNGSDEAGGGGGGDMPGLDSMGIQGDDGMGDDSSADTTSTTDSTDLGDTSDTGASPISGDESFSGSTDI